MCHIKYCTLYNCTLMVIPPMVWMVSCNFLAKIVLCLTDICFSKWSLPRLFQDPIKIGYQWPGKVISSKLDTWTSWFDPPTLLDNGLTTTTPLSQGMYIVFSFVTNSSVFSGRLQTRNKWDLGGNGDARIKLRNLGMTLKSVKRDKHHRVQSATRFHLSGANFFLTICGVCLSGITSSIINEVVQLFFLLLWRCHKSFTSCLWWT